jgi:hypothetical protein
MGPWWMTLSKLETTVRDLRDQVHAARAVHPHLSNTSAIVEAEAEVARAHDCLRRLKSPRPQPGDETLKFASDEIARAAAAVRRARDLAALAGQSSNADERRNLGRLL